MDFKNELNRLESLALSIKGDVLTKSLFADGVVRGAKMVAKRLERLNIDTCLLEHQLDEFRYNVFKKG